MYQIITIGGEIVISDEIYQDFQENLERFYEGEFKHGGILYQIVVKGSLSNAGSYEKARPMWHHPESNLSIFLDQICSIMPIEKREE